MFSNFEHPLLYLEVISASTWVRLTFLSFCLEKKNCYDFKGPSLILHIMPSNKIVTQKIPSMQIYFPSLKLFSLLYRIFKFCVSFIFTFAFVTKAFDLISEESLPRTRSRFYT